MELQKWMTATMDKATNEGLIHSESVINQAMWVRDSIPNALYNTPAWPKYIKDKNLGWTENWNLEKELRPKISVHSTHRSKSCELPVYYMSFYGVNLVMRNNFHDWNVSIRSKLPIVGILTKLFPHDTSYCFYQGFPEHMRMEAYNEVTNNKNFSFYCGSRETLWTFFWLLGQMIKETND